MFYIVPTPIGNFADITIRALDVLRNIDEIICEDTRVTNKLLQFYDIKKSLYVYNDHSGVYEREIIIEKLLKGKKLALVSDAGTPVIADPGYKLIQAIRQRDIKITALPGACSIITALSLANIPTDRFFFAGFLPHNKIARCNKLKEFKTYDASLIFFESAKRLLATIFDMRAIFPDRNVSIVRELTKKYEEIRYGSFSDIIDHYQIQPLKGEIIILLSPDSKISHNMATEEAQLSLLLKQMSVKDAVSIAAANSTYSKKTLYAKALQLKQNNDD